MLEVEEYVTNSVSDENTFNKFVNELKNVDYFFYTESDLSFINFIKVFNEKENFSLLAQVVIRFEKNEFLQLTNRLHPTGDVLNTIPALDLINKQSYQ